MKVTTFGIWEKARLNLRNALIADKNLNLSQEKIDEALLGAVITRIINHSHAIYQRLIHDYVSVHERIFIAHERAIEHTLPALATALFVHPDLLQAHVEKFVGECMTSTAMHAKYLERIFSIAKLAKKICLEQYYGDDFHIAYPELAGMVPFYDPQLLAKFHFLLNREIEFFPLSVRFNLLAHIKLNQEIIVAIKSSEQFERDFIFATGASMQEYKATIDRKDFTTNRVASMNDPILSDDAQNRVPKESASSQAFAMTLFQAQDLTREINCDDGNKNDFKVMLQSVKN